MKPEIDLSLRQLKKNSTDAYIFQNKFGELRDKFCQYQAVYTDGSKVLDRVAAAAVSRSNQCLIRLPNSASIYTAELQALKMAFNLIEHSTGHHFIIFTDSLSSLMALQGNKYDHPYIIELLDLYSELVTLQKSVVLAWVPSHVGIKGNEKVDNLAKEALNLNISYLKIPFTDFKVNVNNYIRSKWQLLWDTFPDNKLHIIQHTVGIDKNKFVGKRREEIVLARAHIGHTYVTHAYLLKSEPMPQCIPCNCPLTVKHILVECMDFGHVRPNYFDVPDMKTLFEKVAPSHIFGFLREIDLFSKF